MRETVLPRSICIAHFIINRPSSRAVAEDMAAVAEAAVTEITIVVVGMVKMMARSSGIGGGITVKDCSS